jgi:uncharacterized protein YjhX (UPF0386 family)
MKALVVAPLNAAQSRVLRVIADGGRMEALRTYPFPRKFKLFSKEGHEYSAGVPEGTVSVLVEMQLVRPVQLDTQGDRIDYFVTTKGVRAVQRKAAADDLDSQLVLLDERPPQQEAVA